MEVDVLYVGAGPATLASALHLMNQVEIHNQRAEQEGRAPVDPPSVLVLEKSAEIGDHLLSGAVMNPKALRELVPDFEEQSFPTEYVCKLRRLLDLPSQGQDQLPAGPAELP
jgi:electron-transferring-flavoprotein dehydrogenase